MLSFNNLTYFCKGKTASGLGPLRLTDIDVLAVERAKRAPLPTRAQQPEHLTKETRFASLREACFARKGSRFLRQEHLAWQSLARFNTTRKILDDQAE